MNNFNYWERYANETLTDAREFMARERLTRHGSTLEVGELPNWLVVALVLVGVGLLLLAL
jgi:hypothetical protein